MPPQPPLRYGFRKLNVDLSLVPPSRHSVFVRGLPRNVSAENVRDTFADECGRCCILFYKSRPNGIFMVLRFDKTDDAKRAIERFDGWKYKGQYRLSVNWYKDVLKYHLDQKQKQSAGFTRPDNFYPPWNHSEPYDLKYKLYGHRAVNRAKRWWHTKPVYNKMARPFQRSYDRPYNRFHNRSFNRSFNQSQEKSHERSDRGSSPERSRERSHDSSHDTSHDTSYDMSHDRTGESSDEHSREHSRERSRERSQERTRDASCERSEVRSARRSDSIERPYDKDAEGNKKLYERPCERSHERSSYSRSRSKSPESGSGKKLSEKRLSRHSPDPERYAKRQKHDTTPQSSTSAEGKAVDTASERLKYANFPQSPELLHSKPESLPKNLKDLEPGEIESSSSQDESPHSSNWDTPREPTEPSQGPPGVLSVVSHVRPVALKPLTKGNPLGPRQPVGLKLSSVKPSMNQSPPTSKLSPKIMSDKIGPYDSYTGGWIEVGKITRKGPKSQYRKFMMGKGVAKDIPQEKDTNEEEKSGLEKIVVDSSDEKNGSEDGEKKEFTCDLRMKRLEEACIVSLHSKSREKFTREIFGPRSSESSDSVVAKPPKPSDKKPLTSLAQIRAEEMAQLDSEIGRHDYELKSPFLKTPKKGSFIPNPEEDTPTKDEHQGVDDGGSEGTGTGTKPFFLRFTPHRLSYQSPLAIFSSLEESPGVSQAGHGRKKIYRPDEENDFAASLVSKLTGTKKYSERTDSTVPSDDRIDLEFIDSELEKSYEEKCSDFHGHNLKTGDSQKSKITPLVPYGEGDISFNKSASDSSQVDPNKDSSRDGGRDEQDEESFVSRASRKSRSFTRSNYRKSSSDSSYRRHDTFDTTTSSSTSITTMETSDSSFSSPTKPIRHGHGKGRHWHVSKRKRSISPNSSIWSTVARSQSRSPDRLRSQSPNRSRSPESRSKKIVVSSERSRSRSTSPNSSWSPSSRPRKQSQRRSKSVSPSRSNSPGNRSWSPTGRCGKKVRSPARSRSTSPSVSPIRRPRRKSSPSTSTSPYNRSRSPSNISASPSHTTRRKSIRSPNRPRSRSTSPGYRPSSPRKNSKSGSSKSISQDDELLFPSTPLSIHCKEMITSTPTKVDQRPSAPKKKAISRGQMQRVLQKKRELEMAFKSDCETICSVTKVLLSKDTSLEEQLCNSAKKTLTDLGSKFVSQLQEFIDSLSTNIPHPQQSCQATRRTTPI